MPSASSPRGGPSEVVLHSVRAEARQGAHPVPVVLRVEEAMSARYGHHWDDRLFGPLAWLYCAVEARVWRWWG